MAKINEVTCANGQYYFRDIPISIERATDLMMAAQLKEYTFAVFVETEPDMDACWEKFESPQGDAQYVGSLVGRRSGENYIDVTRADVSEEAAIKTILNDIADMGLVVVRCEPIS